MAGRSAPLQQTPATGRAEPWRLEHWSTGRTVGRALAAGRFEKSWLMDGPRRVEEAMLMEDRLGVRVVSWQQDGLESTGRVVGPLTL